MLPELPGHLGRSYFAIATAHGVLGMVAELFACYILLVAGTNLLPPRLRFTRYKLWMRAALCGLVYAALWGLYYPLTPFLSGEVWQWLFVAPVVVGAGSA